MRIFLAMTVVMVAISAQTTLPKGSSAAFQIGQPFPDIVLPSLKDGKPASLAQYRGQKLILHIFASW
jgi:hypothetical protein